MFRNLFQFLMVRLKESLLVAAASSLYISIPYGSIKSFADDRCKE